MWLGFPKQLTILQNGIILSGSNLPNEANLLKALEFSCWSRRKTAILWEEGPGGKDWEWPLRAENQSSADSKKTGTLITELKGIEFC